MHIHIIGICGTFMGGVAILAQQLGMKVTGSDAHVYPPMSTQLKSIGIKLMEGFSKDNLSPKIDLVIIGNALSRGNVEVEEVLNQGLPYTSGAQWLFENVLQHKWVMAVSGTHGKTSTAAMLAWILQYAKIDAGFLVGGVLQNFGISARLGSVPFFVIEADEYDTAFFDKRSKFVHYRPQSLLINNLEFDHADIFPNLEAIQTQFHHLVRTVPQNGLIIYPQQQKQIADVLGGWTDTETIGGNWQFELLKNDGSEFKVLFNHLVKGAVNWDLIGIHNINNALGAIALAQHAGVPIIYSIKALAKFKLPKKRMELKAVVNNIRIYDDFAHHPTAIASTITGLRAKVVNETIIAVIELRSNTMKDGSHKDKIANCLQKADYALVFHQNNLEWSLSKSLESSTIPTYTFTSIKATINKIISLADDKSHVLIMSNGDFANIHQKLINKLNEK